MDQKLIIGVFVILVLVVALQAYQLNGINTRLNSLQISGVTATTSLQQTPAYQAPAASAGLPTQVGGC